MPRPRRIPSQYEAELNAGVDQEFDEDHKPGYEHGLREWVYLGNGGAMKRQLPRNQ